jgi:hypothetical protein
MLDSVTIPTEASYVIYSFHVYLMYEYQIMSVNIYVCSKYACLLFCISCQYLLRVVMVVP